MGLIFNQSLAHVSARGEQLSLGEVRSFKRNSIPKYYLTCGSSTYSYAINSRELLPRSLVVWRQKAQTTWNPDQNQPATSSRRKLCSPWQEARSKTISSAAASVPRGQSAMRVESAPRLPLLTRFAPHEASEIRHVPVSELSLRTVDFALKET